MLPPEDRLVGSQLHRYIKDKLYWVLHAPRQTGKTTFLKSWLNEINADGEVVACYVSVEDCQGKTEREGNNIGMLKMDFARQGGQNVSIPESVIDQ
jgi:predicted AAA+ superfamily ATPase